MKRTGLVVVYQLKETNSHGHSKRNYYLKVVKSVCG